MKNILLLAGLYALMAWGCQGDGPGRASDAPASEEPTLEPVAYTLYGPHTELFVEFKPLAVGAESRFAAHVTVLGELFTALTEGKVTVNLTNNGSFTIDSADQPGIFRPKLTPTTAGQNQTLTFLVTTPAFTDTFTIPDLTVYPDEATALAAQPPEAASNDISYLKEQAWKTEFANAEVKLQPFAEVIRTTGQIISAPGDEAVVAAPTDGMVTFSGDKLLAGQTVGSGAMMFSISGSRLNEGSLEARIRDARLAQTKAKADYDRLAPLAADRIVSQREFLDAKHRYDVATQEVQSLSRNYGKNGVRVTAPMGGFIRTLHVSPGQYVQAGQPLATLVKNKRLMVRADVSQQNASKIPVIRSANFVMPDGQAFSLEDLDGRLTASGKSAEPGNPFIPVFFEIDARPNFLPGTYVDTYLRSGTPQLVLAVPKSALLEEQGVFSVYVQTEGESFQKREVKIGATDGVNVQVFSGIQPGERVVTKGVYQIKLSSMSGAMPAHGHEH